MWQYINFKVVEFARLIIFQKKETDFNLFLGPSNYFNPKHFIKT